MDNLNGDYIRGYTTALINVLKFLDDHSEAMKVNKMYNQNCVRAVLNFLLENKEEMRETGTIEDIVVSKEKNKVIIKKIGRYF